MIKDELLAAEEAVNIAEANLAEVRRKNLVLAMLKYSISNVRKRERLEYNIMLLRYYLFERRIFTPEEFAEYDEPGMPLVTPEYLAEVEKDEYDQKAEYFMKEMESLGSVNDPDAALEKIKEFNSKGHKRIAKAKLEGLNKDVLRHKTENAQEKLTVILTDNKRYPAGRQDDIAELIKLIESSDIPYEEFKIDKGRLFEIGYTGI